MIGRFVLIASIILGSAIMIRYGPQIATSRSDPPRIETMAPVGSAGPLDGMEFAGKLGPEGKPKDVKDRFVFSRGTFVSRECELRCDYPARAYFISETGNGTRFISNTKCPYKDAEITWRGTVKGNQISGTATWTIRRWYWTVTKTFEFDGKINEKLNITVGARGSN